MPNLMLDAGIDGIPPVAQKFAPTVHPEKRMPEWTMWGVFIRR
jgi:hypothetical protein